MKDAVNRRTNKKNMRKIYAVDLFCGAGGLTKGLENAGVHVAMGVDCDPACKYPYIANNDAEFRLESVENLKGETLNLSLRKNGIRLLAGCAPCQTFSTYNQKADKTDKRWWLLLEFARLVKELRPELVTMENVPKLAEHKVFKSFIKELEALGYKVAYYIVNCADYGIPQRRRRLVLMASIGGTVELFEPTHKGSRKRTVRSVIGNLPALRAGETDTKDPLHRCSALSALNLKRIKASKPGGTWRDWNKTLVADCHKKSTGKTYPGVYGRMNWDEPSPTITTQFFGFGNGRFGHPEQDRALSLREGAIIQSFPKSYIFVQPAGPVSIKDVGRLIGNAVPVKLGEVIGKSLLKHVEKYADLFRKKRTVKGI